MEMNSPITAEFQEEIDEKIYRSIELSSCVSKHKHMLEDMTMVFWAMDTEDKCEDLFSRLLLESLIP